MFLIVFDGLLGGSVFNVPVSLAEVFAILGSPTVSQVGVSVVKSIWCWLSTWATPYSGQ
jgi:hypothetical protein